jgi:hypothetical protein
MASLVAPPPTLEGEEPIERTDRRLSEACSLRAQPFLPRRLVEVEALEQVAAI